MNSVMVFSRVLMASPCRSFEPLLKFREVELAQRRQDPIRRGKILAARPIARRYQGYEACGPRRLKSVGGVFDGHAVLGRVALFPEHEFIGVGSGFLAGDLVARTDDTE